MHTFIYEYMMDLVAPLVAPALSQKPAFVTYFVARGAPRPSSTGCSTVRCYSPVRCYPAVRFCYSVARSLLDRRGINYHQFLVEFLRFLYHNHTNA